MGAEANMDELLAEYQVTRDRETRNRIVEANLFMVEHFVGRFSHSGRISADDCRQVALVALIGAVERYDASFGASLATFVARTVDGELKRYMRDRSWLVRPPRSYQDAHLQVRRGTDELAQQLGRLPSVHELSRHLCLDEKYVRRGLGASRSRSYESLNLPGGSHEGSSIPSEQGAADGGFNLAEIRLTLRSEISHLTEREQTVLRMRFLEGLSQIEIAQLIGVSQSYVSRIIHAALGTLRSATSIRDLESVDMSAS